jgi:hypothetical protein
MYNFYIQDKIFNRRIVKNRTVSLKRLTQSATLKMNQLQSLFRLKTINVLRNHITVHYRSLIHYYFVSLVES